MDVVCHFCHVHAKTAQVGISRSRSILRPFAEAYRADIACDKGGHKERSYRDIEAGLSTDFVRHFLTLVIMIIIIDNA